jgi:hypothetical protein
LNQLRVEATKQLYLYPSPTFILSLKANLFSLREERERAGEYEKRRA